MYSENVVIGTWFRVGFPVQKRFEDLQSFRGVRSDDFKIKHQDTESQDWKGNHSIIICCSRANVGTISKAYNDIRGNTAKDALYVARTCTMLLRVDLMISRYKSPMISYQIDNI